jgi:hypothetical protein
VLERLKFEVGQGRGEEPCHLVDINAVAKERIKNDKKVTRFVLGTDDPDACAALHAESHRIIKRARNKSVAISLMIRAWKDALADGEIDRILAEDECP